MDITKSESLLKETMKKIRQKLREERDGRNWDIAEVSKRSGVSQSVIYTLDCGIADNVTVKSLIGLSIAFEFDFFSIVK